MLQEFNLEIRDKKGAKNLVANHLSRLENPHIGRLKEDNINEAFPKDCLYNLEEVIESKTPWFVDIDNYLVANILPMGFHINKRRGSFFYLKDYLWEDPYLFKI